MIKNRYLSLSVPEKRILWTTLGIAIFFTLFATTVFDTLVNAPNLQYRFANSVPFVITLIALASAVLILNGKTTSGVWLLQLGSLALLIANTTQAEGFGFPSALILIAITLYVPFVVLPGNVASASMGIGLLGAVIIVLVDTFWSGTRVPALSQDVTTATILSVVLAAFLIGTTVVRFNSYVFRTKLIIAFGLIA